MPFQLQPEKKRYSRLAIICCAVPIAIVAAFQLQPEKKDTVVCLLLRRSKYNRKKKIWRVRNRYYDREK